MTETPLITFGVIVNKPEIFNSLLYPCLIKQTRPYYLFIVNDDKDIAKNYNKIIEKSTTDYVVLIHADVTISNDFVEILERNIHLPSNFGAFGIVGNAGYGIEWAKSDRQYVVETVDSCFIMINKKHGIRFDEKTFDEYHLYVEDYCVQVYEKLGFRCYTLLIDAGVSSDKPPGSIEKNHFCHHSATYSVLGSCWGNYLHYKDKLFQKWGREIATT